MALQWNHKWGANLKGWQKTYDEGGDPPATFFNRPEVRDDLIPIQVAFYELTTERQTGMGVGYIPASKIREYGREELGMFDDRNNRFFSIVRQMDEEYVKLANESPKDKRSGQQIPIDDVEGVKSLFSSIENRPKNDMPRKPKKT